LSFALFRLPIEKSAIRQVGNSNPVHEKAEGGYPSAD
jgi:hypothetical protein